MANDDALRSDEHLSDKQPENPLTLRNRGAPGCLAQTGEEASEVLGELKIPLAIHGLGFERFELGLKGRGLLSELGRAAAQLVQGDQLLLIGLHEAVDGALRSSELALQLRLLHDNRAGSPQLLETALELCMDELGIGEQGRHVVPNHLIQVVLANRGVAADPTLFVAVVVGAQAAVVLLG